MYLTDNTFINNAWNWKCDLPEDHEQITFDYEAMKKSEWSTEFEQLMRNRLIMGAMRYGKLNSPNKPIYDRVASAIKRLNKYIETGNLEFLVDVANICLIEFVEGTHLKKHFNSIDDGEHIKVKSL